MTAAKPTPGPWRVSHAAPTKTRGIDIMGGHAKFIAHVPFHHAVWQSEEYREQDRANARLIAAAPDLLMAAENVANFAWSSITEIDCSEAAVHLNGLLTKLRAAIAAATSETT